MNASSITKGESTVALASLANGAGFTINEEDDTVILVSETSDGDGKRFGVEAARGKLYVLPADQYVWPVTAITLSTS